MADDGAPSDDDVAMVDAPAQVIDASPAPPEYDNWSEKYRPGTLDDVYGNPEAVGYMKNLVRKICRPASHPPKTKNVMLAGPSGTGKTSAMMAFAHDLLGEAFKIGETVLVCRPSDYEENEEDELREKIETFAKTRIALPKGTCKCVLLDEVDQADPDVQMVFRRAMEDFSERSRFCRGVRFVLTCNEIDEGLEALPWCKVLPLTLVADKSVRERVENILIETETEFDEDGLNAIVYTAEGDLRAALDIAQAARNACGVLVPGTGRVRFSGADLRKSMMVASKSSPEMYRQVLQACVRGDLRTAIKEFDEAHSRGLTTADFASTLFWTVQAASNEELPRTKRLSFMKALATLSTRMKTGFKSRLQVHGMLAKIC